jgi:hypothetical protein
MITWYLFLLIFNDPFLLENRDGFYSNYKLVMTKGGWKGKNIAGELLRFGLGVTQK